MEEGRLSNCFRGQHLVVALIASALTLRQTDDVGVFASPLSQEYLLAAQHFDLTTHDLVKLSRSAVDCIFGSDGEKDRLHRLLDEFAANEGLVA